MDIDIVKKAKQGDEQAFTHLIDKQKNNIYKIAYCYANNEQDALDIVSETVFRAYISIKKLKKPQYFNTWLTRILINCAINYLKKTK